jgi:hypothetical protein
MRHRFPTASGIGTNDHAYGDKPHSCAQKGDENRLRRIEGAAFGASSSHILAPMYTSAGGVPCFFDNRKW